MLLLLRVFGCCLPVCLSPSISRAFSSHGTRLPPGSKPLPGCVEEYLIGYLSFDLKHTQTLLAINCKMNRLCMLQNIINVITLYYHAVVSPEQT